MPKRTVKVKKVEQPATIIQIPSPDIRTVSITIEGVTPLLVNNFDEKTKQEIEDSYQKKAKTKAAPKSPQECFDGALYKIPGVKNAYGVPTSGLKHCAVNACRFVDGMKMTNTRGAFHVISGPGGLIRIKGPKPIIDKRTVRVGNFGNKKPATRYRPRWDKWELSFKVTYNAGVISPEQLLNLYETAGFSVGLCELRPEKNGSLGMFRVKRG